MTQESAVRMKSEYEDKVNFLEKQSIEQSKLLAAQTEQLNNITKGMMMDHQSKKQTDRSPERESNLNKKLLMRQQSENFNDDTLDSESSHKTKKSIVSKEPKQFLNSFKSKPIYSKLVTSKKSDESPRVVKESITSKPKDKKIEKAVVHEKVTKAGSKYSSLDESEKTDSTLSESETETDEDTEEETSESEGSRTESTNDEEERPPKVKEEKQLKVNFIL